MATGDIQSEILARKINLVSRNSEVGLVATTAASLILVAVSRHSQSFAWWVLWWLALVIVSAVRVGLARRYFHEEARHDVDPVAWSRHYAYLIFVLSLLWTSGTIAFSWDASDVERALAALVVAAMSAGAISTLAPVINLYRLYAAPMIFSVAAVSFLSTSETFGWLFGFISLTYLYGISRSASYLHETLNQSITLAISERNLVNELQFANMVYQAIGNAVLITDTQGGIVACNPAFAQMSGYDSLGVIGKNFHELGSGRQDHFFYQRIWQSLVTLGEWRGEIYNRRKSGEDYLKWLTINAIHDENGEPFRYVALFSDVTDQKRAEEMVWRESNYDSLTALPNRRLFHDRLEQEIRKVQRGHLGVALLIVDLDRFNEVNDTLGHSVGDLLLIEAAGRIMTCIRLSDTLARTGGDEFSIILAEFPDAAHVERAAQDIVQKLRAAYQLNDEAVYISTTIGVAFYPTDAADADELIKNADQAMFACKKMGGDRYGFFTTHLQEAAQQRRRMINELRGALDAGQFRLVFQPIVSLQDGRILKAETLLRWEHPELGMISPVEFIPLAEETGLINSIGDWVFREAVTRTKAWNDEFGGDIQIQISINKSPVQFHTMNNAATWVRFLEEIGLQGEYVVIEITESMMLDSNPNIAAQLAKYRDAGIRISIDDFGTGYSSLSYLKKFDANYLKIDQSFVRDLESDKSDLALSEAIIVMAHKLGIKVIAEGIETERQRLILMNAGCDYGQGYLFSRPIPAEAFEGLLRRQRGIA